MRLAPFTAKGDGEIRVASKAETARTSFCAAKQSGRGDTDIPYVGRIKNRLSRRVRTRDSERRPEAWTGGGGEATCNISPFWKAENGYQTPREGPDLAAWRWERC